MKAMAGIFGALVGLLLVGAVGYLLLRPPAPAKSDSPGAGSSSASGHNGGVPHPDKPIEAIKSKDDLMKEDLAKRRIPYYRFLHQNFDDSIEHFSVLDDYDTLDVVLKSGDNAILMHVLQKGIAPTAKEYGFRRARFYTRNAPTDPQPLTLLAEASEDGTGRWNAFMK